MSAVTAAIVGYWLRCANRHETTVTPVRVSPEGRPDFGPRLETCPRCGAHITAREPLWGGVR